MAKVWSINPTTNVSIGENTGLVTFIGQNSGNYTVTCRDGNSCGTFTIKRECGTPPAPIGNEIQFKIKNKSGVEVRLSGKAKINASRTASSSYEYMELDANFHGPQTQTSWDRNDIIIPANGETALTIENLSYVLTCTNGIDHIDESMKNVDFTDGTWYFLNSNITQFKFTIMLYTRIWSRSRNEYSGSAYMYGLTPLQNTAIVGGSSYNLELHWHNEDAYLADDSTTKSTVPSDKRYAILAYNKNSLA
jgi:hypothetical protein